MMKSLDIFQTDWEGIEALLKTIGLSLAILLAFYFLANVLQKFLRKRLLVRMDDPLLANFLSVVFRLIIILLGFLLVFRIIGLTGLVSGLLAGAGITAFVIGFALKDIGENFLAGILLAFKRPFKVGDTVDINGIRGVVLNLNLRDTQIKTPDGKDVFIPNATIIKNPLVNFTIDGFLRYDFIVGLDYGSDYQVARALILEAIQKVPGVLMDTKTPKVWVSELAESTLNLQVAFWVDTFDRKIADLEVKSQAIIQVLTTLEKAGYNLPARVLEIKNYRDQPIKSS
ncbi:MAG TPA: mechanosensitive ion channel protein MscS [Algoriphagus sp.]|jgi:small-conductance mechanosensitive channel|uniref:mechanosensitive ion channel family protein n=2 Tax=Algoriphagus TaxID=246875 RepID=UPI000C3C7A00|nr:MULTISPECIES: mechanosensitive ion channel family protein [unclassified Algoriphagus]MAL12138.1 mechanosensitive ion channel protein MscS [Algoriphagus sp.]HAD49864.1 mechanosensitive ion channel protein MscS [Algoriphagus sp.]HAH36967.1 mechanosensitive ion channel protein MscS [Algoriphagus sp.]HAS59647.1 mechanosensitive ion channel protein MscS [Algoriphagus sp.]HCB46315.1 mechanosensitive ion channel protein MscS [Algoriphagus sp.]|tara:strand:- start:3516 stop:4370 length:855 start_codon:yes stop_codon:yes gene_type:complete